MSLLSLLQSWTAARQEAPEGDLVPFGSSPAASFSLSEASATVPGQTVLHVYGSPPRSLQSQLSSIPVGAPVPAEKRLKFASELFDVVDVGGQRVLDAHKLQVALRVLALPHRPKDVIKRYGSVEGGLLLEDFSMFISAASKTHALLALVPLDLLQEVRSLYSIVASDGMLDRQELGTLVSYLGLDWSHEDVDNFLRSRGAHGLLQFMAAFVRIIEQGAVTGTKTLTVRNWFPGMWYVRERKKGDRSALFLLCQTDTGGWTDAGQVISAATRPEQPFLIGLRMSDGRKYNLLISKLDAAHARPFRQAATMYSSPDEPLGVISTETVARLINSITGCVNLGKLSRHDIIRNVFALLVGDVEVVQEDELLVVLKVLGQHAEPEHLTYLLSLAPRKKLGSLHLEELISLLENVDVKLALPMQTIEKLKEAFNEFDEDGDGALSAMELQSLSVATGLGWSTKDLMTLLGVESKKGKKITDPVLIDFLQFIDAVIEVHGDPFYELRYRYLFRLIDVDGSDSLQDEEVVPLLKAAGLDEESARAAALRLLGDQLTMNYNQFSAAMVEEQITGESFPLVLLQMAKAFSNIDVDDKFEIDANKLLVIFRKLGVKFTVADRDALFKQMDTANRGAASFTEFAVSFTRVDTSKLGGLADAFNVATLASVTSYELTSSVDELDTLRDVASRPILERTAAGLLERKGKHVAEVLDKQEVEAQRKLDGILDHRAAASASSFTPTTVLRITLCCWFCVLRCTAYGIASGGFNVLLEQASNTYFPIAENPPTGAFAHYNVWVHYIIAYLPSIILSFIEALIIYYDLLRTSLNVAEIAGLKLYPLDPVRLFVTNSILAEALELGHPSYTRYGIDPMRGSSKAVLYLCGLLYAARGGLSKFLLKIILRRVVSRSAVKGVFPLIGLPIVAFWNAVLANQVMHAVRTVALGRLCITSVTDSLLGMHQELTRQLEAGVELQKAVELSRTKSFAMASPESSFDQLAMPDALKAAILRTVAASVVSARSFHPNVELLMKHLMFRLRIDPESIPDLDSVDVFTKSCLPSLSRIDSYTVLSFLALALTLDGELLVTEKIFMKLAQASCGLSPNLSGLTRMATKFGNLSLQPEDVVFVFYDIRERDGGVADITTRERAEEAISKVLKLLSF